MTTAAETPGTGAAPAALEHVLRAGTEVETVAMGPNRIAFLLTGADTSGRYSLTDFTIAAPPALGPPPHIHEDADEAVYVLEGTLEMGIGEEVMTGSPGGVMLVPRGTRHSLRNLGPGPARILVVLTPPGFEGFWREVAGYQATHGAPPDPETMRALQRTYHMETGGAARRLD